MLDRRFDSSITFLFLSLIYFLPMGTQAATPAPVVITNVTVIDGTAAEPAHNLSILINGIHIESVSAQLDIPAGANVLDGEGMVVMPGIIDMHTHPTFEIRTASPRMPFPDPSALPASDKDMKDFIKTRLPGRLELFLERGVTTVISAGGYWPYDISIRDRIKSGELRGPRLLVASPIFTAPGGHPASGICSGKAWCASRLSFETADAESARRGVRRYAAGGVQAIKLVYDSFDKTKLGGPDFKFPRLDLEVVKAIVDEARSAQLPVIAHTKTVDETADITGMGVDALVHSALMENSDFTTSDGRHLPTLVAEHGLTVTTTVRGFYERLLSATGKRRDRMEKNFKLVGPSLEAYRDAGITLMFGTDFDGAGLAPDPGDAVQSEAEALVAAGFSNHEVIRMASGNASMHPMVPDDIGKIKSGMVADILLLNENPLDDISAITRPVVVIKNGQVVIDKR